MLLQPHLPRIRSLCAQYPEIFHYEVEHVGEIGEALTSIARVKPRVLVLNGGDGTVQAALTGLQPKGQVHAATLQWQGPWNAPKDYRVKAQLHQLGLAPYAAAGFPGLGVEGLDAEIDATQTGGTAKWVIKKGALAVPTWLEEGRVALDTADASLRWSWVDGRLRLEMPRLQFTNADAAGELALVWSAPRTAPVGQVKAGKGAAAAGLGAPICFQYASLTAIRPSRIWYTSVPSSVTVWPPGKGTLTL